MFKKSLSTLCVAFLVLMASVSYAEKYKYPKLKAAPAPCLFLLDDEGNDTTTVANAPCEINGTIVNPGGNVIPNHDNANKAGRAKVKNARDLDSDGDSILDGASH